MKDFFEWVAAFILYVLLLICVGAIISILFAPFATIFQ